MSSVLTLDACKGKIGDRLFEIIGKKLEYEPTGLQEAIILAVGCGRYKIVVAFDANRVGKTTTIVNIAKNIF
jgi:hypothetical protein